MIHYILQIISFQLLFLVVYEFFLKKETFFNWNRAYLLLTPILSFVLPFAKIPFLRQSVPNDFKISLPEFFQEGLRQTPTAVEVLPEVVVTGNAPHSFYDTLLTIWWLGVVVTVVLFAFKLYRIKKLANTGTIINMGGLRIISIPQSSLAFSFFNTIYLGADLSEKQRESILMHEAIHVREKHSLDMLFFELQRIVCWFNPLVYAYQRNMKTLQEYRADAQVVAQSDKPSYYQNLLEQIFQTENITFINTFFNHSLIKKRIIMLQKSKSKKLARLKYVLVIPVICSMLFYVACSENADESVTTKEIDAVDVNSIEQNEVDDNNLIVTLMSFNRGEVLLIGVKDARLLSEDELSFIDVAKTEEGFKDLREGKDSFKDTAEMFLVDYTHRLKQLMESMNLTLTELYSNKDVTVVEEVEVVEEVPLTDLENIPFAVVEKVPTFPGCSGSNAQLKECMTQKVRKHVAENFNHAVGNNLELESVSRIFVSFKINNSGYLTNIRARAQHPDLEDEALRVMQLLPNMEPGEQDGRPVGVLYSLPITFKIQE